MYHKVGFDHNAVLDAGVVQELEELLGAEKVERLSWELEATVIRVINKLSTESICLDDARDANDLVAIAGQFGCTELMQEAKSLNGAIRRAEIKVPTVAEGFVKAAQRAVTAVRERYAD